MSDTDSVKSNHSPLLPSQRYSFSGRSQHHSSDDDAEEVIQYVTKAKLEKFFKNFKDMPETEDLLMVKSCSLEKEVLFPGDFYVTRNFFCFAGKLFKRTVLVVLPVRNVLKIEKKKFGLLSNSIRIEGPAGAKMNIASLSKRDAVFDFINIIWKTTMDPAFQQSQMVDLEDISGPSTLKAAKTKFFSLEGLFEELKEELSDVATPVRSGSLSLDSEEDRRRSLDMKKVDSKELYPQIVVSDDRLDECSPPQPEKFTKPEKIYRKKLAVDTTINAAKGSQTPPSPTTDLPSPISVAGQSRHSVITLVKEKSKKKEEKEEKKHDVAVPPEPILTTQRILFNDVFNAGAGEIFAALFGSPHKVAVSSQSDFVATPWEEKEGIKSRSVTFTETIKVTSKDKDKYRSCKFKQTQQIVTEQSDYYLVSTESWSLDPEIQEGLFRTTTFTITEFSESIQGKKSRLTISCLVKVARMAGTSKEYLDSHFDTWEASTRELGALLAKEYAGVVPPPTPQKPVAPEPEPKPVAPPHNWFSGNSKLPLLVVGSICVVLLAIIISLLWIPASDGLTPQEKQWLSFIQNTKSKSPQYDPSEFTKLFHAYQDRTFPKGELEQLGEKASSVAEKLKRLSRGVARPVG